MPNPHGRMKNGSRIIFRIHPLIVPMLACNDAPSALTIYPMTTFKIVGIAPHTTAQFMYTAVAAAVFASPPRSTTNGCMKIKQSVDNIAPLITVP